MRLISILLLWTSVYGQTSLPLLEEFDSFDGVGEWVSPGGTSGSHAGELCFNIGSNYSSNVWYVFESPIYDFTSYNSVELFWQQEINLRPGDELRLYYFDLSDSLWYYFSLEGLGNGFMFATIPNTANQITFDLLTTGSGNRNGKYAHISFLELSAPTVLPIELLDFEARVDRGIVYIDWSTASESNNDFFKIQRSQDGNTWEGVGEIKGAGNSTSRLSYTMEDREPYFGVSYYRLSQTDFDGTTEIFNPITVTVDEPYIVRRYNQLGQDVSNDYKGLVIILMSDGSIKKILNFN